MNMGMEWDCVARLLCAAVIGGLIGLNRDLHGKAAGVRTHALVALGSALILVVGERLPGMHATPDAQSRIIQGLVTGIGFLGAGVILHAPDAKKVHGLTTAATVWIASLLGAGCGVGAYAPVFIAAVLMFLVLILGGRFEHAVHRWLGPQHEPGEPKPPNV